MKIGPTFAFFLAACLASAAEANDFDVQVSYAFTDRKIEIQAKQALMEYHYFVEQVGGRTVWSQDATIGKKTHGRDNGIYAHATFVINTRKRRGENTTVNIDANKVHITSWYPDARRSHSSECHVYENGRCDCDERGHWRICSKRTLVHDFASAAIEARRAAKRALEEQGVTVTDNPTE